MTNSATQGTVYLKEYTVPPFFIPEVVLDVDLVSEEHARVRSVLSIERNSQFPKPAAPLQLDLEELSVESLAIDGVPLDSSQYTLSASSLTIAVVPDAFQLETVSRLNPKQNTKLMGLYTSSTGFFTLCEAQGFRRITPFLDRPDVMSRYTVTLHADRASCPVLLANGNLTAEGSEAEGRHWATWKDPFPKPSYLFAIVAAKLDRIADELPHPIRPEGSAAVLRRARQARPGRVCPQIPQRRDEMGRGHLRAGDRPGPIQFGGGR